MFSSCIYLPAVTQISLPSPKRCRAHSSRHFSFMPPSKTLSIVAKMPQIVTSRCAQLKSTPFLPQLVHRRYVTIILRTYNGRIWLWLNSSNHFNSLQSSQINCKCPNFVSDRPYSSTNASNWSKTCTQVSKMNAMCPQIVTLRLSSPPIITNHPSTPQNGLETRLECTEFIANRPKLLYMSSNRRRNVPNSSQMMTNALPTRK